MIKNISDLIDLKTIISLMLITTTCYLVITGKVETETFMMLVTAVITYYFTRKKEVE